MRFLALVTLILSAACGPSPTEVASQFIDAVNRGNAEAALAMTHAQIRVDAFGDVMVGQAQAATWLNTAATAGARFTPSALTAKSGKVTWTAEMTSRELSELGISALSVDAEANIQGGKVSTFTVAYKDAALTTLTAARATHNQKLAASLASALDARDVDGVLRLLAEDAQVNVVPNTRYNGRQEISAWLKTLKHVSAQSTPEASSERASWKAGIDAGSGKQEMKLSALIRHGKVQALTVSSMK